MSSHTVYVCILSGFFRLVESLNTDNPSFSQGLWYELFKLVVSSVAVHFISHSSDCVVFLTLKAMRSFYYYSPYFWNMKMEKLFTLSNLMCISVSAERLLEGFSCSNHVFQNSLSLSLFMTSSSTLHLQIEECPLYSSCSPVRLVCRKMSSEERSSAISQKISSLSRSNSSSSSKHDSRQVTLLLYRSFLVVKSLRGGKLSCAFPSFCSLCEEKLATQS